LNNEPVAWIEKDGMVRFDVKWASQMQGKEPIPLYTHPADLTNEEIYKIAMEVQTGFFPQDDTLAFARAILRKAQEK
jgi:hypothetical protein